MIRKSKNHNLISLLLLVSVLAPGCSEQYMIERMLWQAQKAAQPIILNEGDASPYEFERAISLYNKVIEKSTASNYALTAYFKIADLYILKKSFDKARDIYDNIEKSHQGRQELCALALFSKAQTYEKENNWTEALKTFNQILAKYSKTRESLNVPIYIAHYYLKAEDRVSAQEAYEKAREYYERKISEYPNTQFSLLSENYILRTYLEQENWNKAVEYINILDKKYKLGSDTLLVLAGIYKNKLNDKEKAKETYKRFLTDFPQNRLETLVKKEIEQLEK